MDDLTALACAGIEGRLADLRAQREAFARAFHTFETDLDTVAGLYRDLLEAMSEHLPPFAVGDTVRPTLGRAKGLDFVVEAIERAFGGWVVRGHFPGGNPTQRYTYMASELEA